MSRRTITLLLATLVTVFGAVPAAIAKGPESATLTGPGIDEPIQLMDGVEEGEAMNLSGLWTGHETRVNEPTGDLGPQYVVSWVNMGPPEFTVEQRTIVEYVYPEASGGPVVHRPEQEGLRDWHDGSKGWFQAKDQIVATIDELVGEKVVEPQPVATTVAPVSPQPIPVDGASPWWIFVAAAMIGAGLVFRRLHSEDHRSPT